MYVLSEIWYYNEVTFILLSTDNVFGRVQMQTNMSAYPQ